MIVLYVRQKTMAKAILIMIFVVGLLGCSDGRPDQKEATRQFEKLYPNAEVFETTVTEDEVIARSVEFHYITRDLSQKGKIEIQFMKKENRNDWIPSPAPPESLP